MIYLKAFLLSILAIGGLYFSLWLGKYTAQNEDRKWVKIFDKIGGILFKIIIFLFIFNLCILIFK